MAGGKLNMVVFIAMIVAVLLQSSVAQTTEHVVGEELGWIVPPGGAIVYSTWASNQTFIVGDVLVFNFVNGTHDVAEVTKTAYETCNTSNTTSLATTSPVRITLSTAGEHFFLCTFPRHCSLGQQLAINVTATAPPPSSATPPSPTPTASPPSPTASPPSPTASPPSPTASPPSPTASPPSPTASPPSPTTSPPSPTASPLSPPTSSPSPTSSPPPPTATPPTTSATPPSTSTTPPAPSSAPSFAVAALPVTIMSIVVALLY